MMVRARRELLAVLQRTRAAEVAARCRVSPSQVSRWSSGTSKPSRRARALLASAYGIDPGGWSSRVRFTPSVHGVND